MFDELLNQDYCLFFNIPTICQLAIQGIALFREIQCNTTYVK